jgi:hypothetical protein
VKRPYSVTGWIVEDAEGTSNGVIEVLCCHWPTDNDVNRDLRQGSQDSNRVLPTYKSKALLLHQHVRSSEVWNWCKQYLNIPFMYHTTHNVTPLENTAVSWNNLCLLWEPYETHKSNAWPKFRLFIIPGIYSRRGTRHYATSRKVAGSIPDVIGFFNWPNPSSRTMALGSTQPLTEMSTRNLPGGKERPAHKPDNLTAIYEPTV